MTAGLPCHRPETKCLAIDITAAYQTAETGDNGRLRRDLRPVLFIQSAQRPSNLQWLENLGQISLSQ